jgi:exodeoxyribonuclease-3
VLFCIINLSAFCVKDANLLASDMRITTWNVNGMRAAIRKGIDRFLLDIDPDVLLLQEIRCLPEQLPAQWAAPEGWHVHWHPAEKKGYAGVALWAKEPFSVEETGLNGPDPEGRVLRVNFKDWSLASIYLPSGSSNDERQLRKEAWMKSFADWAKPMSTWDKPVLLAGDLNIAHTELDIHNPKGNKNNSGFLPHERQWFSDFLDGGWHDLMRLSYGPAQGPYSWWSNRGRARELNRGWRIDYILGNEAAKKRFRRASTLREGGLLISDHAPVTADFD